MCLCLRLRGMIQQGKAPLGRRGRWGKRPTQAASFGLAVPRGCRGCPQGARKARDEAGAEAVGAQGPCCACRGQEAAQEGGGAAAGPAMPLLT